MSPLPFIKPKQSEKTLTPKEQRLKALKAQEEKIEKEYDRKIKIVKLKKRFWQIAIIIVPIVVVCSLAYGGYWYYQRVNQPGPEPPPPPEAPPEDFGIDIESLTFIPVEEKKDDFIYDVVAFIKNKNTEWGVSRFNYTFDLLDDTGKVIAGSQGNNYILPGESKSLINVNLSSSNKASKGKLDIEIVEVEKLHDYERPDIKTTNLEVGLSQTGKTQLTGDIANRSPFSFDTVDLNVILYNQQDEIVAVNYTNINNLFTDFERGFAVTWEKNLRLDSPKAIVEPNVNLFSDENFIQRYGTGQVLQY